MTTTSALTGIDYQNLKAGESLLQFFEFSHLNSSKLQEIASQFWHLAVWMVASLPRNSERTVALRMLLEAKDCALRAELFE